jgi:hypothetical protein
MGKEDVVEIHCSRCRSRIPVEDLFAGRAVSVGQYCFCSRCIDEHQVKEIQQIRKEALATGQRECRRKVVHFDRR